MKTHALKTKQSMFSLLEKHCPWLSTWDFLSMFTKMWNDLVFFHLSLQIHDPLLFGSSPRSQALWINPHFFLTPGFQLSSLYGNRQCSQQGEEITPGIHSWILYWRVPINCLCSQTKDYCLPQGISWYAALLSFLNTQEGNGTFCLPRALYLPLWFSYARAFVITSFKTTSLAVKFVETVTNTLLTGWISTR